MTSHDEGDSSSIPALLNSFQTFLKGLPEGSIQQKLRYFIFSFILGSIFSGVKIVVGAFLDAADIVASAIIDAWEGATLAANSLFTSLVIPIEVTRGALIGPFAELGFAAPAATFAASAIWLGVGVFVLDLVNRILLNDVLSAIPVIGGLFDIVGTLYNTARSLFGKITG